MPIAQAVHKMRERGHIVAASLLAGWVRGLAFIGAAVMFFFIDHLSGIAAAARYVGILLTLAYWLMDAWFLRRRWARTP